VTPAVAQKMTPPGSGPHRQTDRQTDSTAEQQCWQRDPAKGWPDLVSPEAPEMFSYSSCTLAGEDVYGGGDWEPHAMLHAKCLLLHGMLCRSLKPLLPATALPMF